MSKINSLYLYFNKKNLKPHLDLLYTTRASKNLAFCLHIFSILYSFRTTSRPRGTTWAHMYTPLQRIYKNAARHTLITTSFATRKLLIRQSWLSKLTNFFFFPTIFLIFIYLCIYTYIHLQINILKPSWCLNLIPRQVFCINFSRRIQIL